MDTEDLLNLKRVAEQVSASYAKRCWWAELNDLRNEAWVAALEARETWTRRGDPSKGELAGYAYRAAALAVRRYLLNNSSPASASWRDVDELANIERVAVPDTSTGRVRAKQFVAATESADQRLHELRTNAAVRDRLFLVISSTTDGRDMAKRVLLDGEKSGRVAKDLGVAERKVYQAVGSARRRVRTDRALKQLMVER